MIKPKVIHISRRSRGRRRKRGKMGKMRRRGRAGEHWFWRVWRLQVIPWSPLERDRMAQGEPNQLYWVGFFLFGPFPEENMFGFS